MLIRSQFGSLIECKEYNIFYHNAEKVIKIEIFLNYTTVKILLYNKEDASDGFLAKKISKCMNGFLDFYTEY